MHLDFTHDGKQYINCAREAARAVGVPDDVIAAAEAAQSQAIARQQCAAHIQRHYPLYRQINILRGTDTEAIARMSIFIDSCRAWSNGANPDPAALEAIQP